MPKAVDEARDMIHAFASVACDPARQRHPHHGGPVHSAECDRLTRAALDPFALVRLFDPPLRLAR